MKEEINSTLLISEITEGKLKRIGIENEHVVKKLINLNQTKIVKRQLKVGPFTAFTCTHLRSDAIGYPVDAK